MMQASTMTPSAHHVMAMRCLPDIGFSLNIFQTSSAISSGVRLPASRCRFWLAPRKTPSACRGRPWDRP